MPLPRLMAVPVERNQACHGQVVLVGTTDAEGRSGSLAVARVVRDVGRDRASREPAIW